MSFMFILFWEWLDLKWTKIDEKKNDNSENDQSIISWRDSNNGFHNFTPSSLLFTYICPKISTNFDLFENSISVCFYMYISIRSLYNLFTISLFPKSFLKVFCSAHLFSGGTSNIVQYFFTFRFFLFRSYSFFF